MVKKPKLKSGAPSVDALGRQVCGNCHNWERLSDSAQTAGEDVCGECWLNPPTVLGINEEGETVQSSPLRYFRERCGQHQPQVN